MSNLIDFQEFFKIFIKKYKIFNESSILTMKIKVQMRFDVSQSKKKFKVCSIQHRSKLIFDSKISFLFKYYPFQGSFDHREMWYTQRNHIDNIITNSCKLICNIPGSGLEFHLVSQDIYLMAKWFDFYCLIFRPILYKKRWRFATTSYVISLTVPSLSQFIIFTSL